MMKILLSLGLLITILASGHTSEQTSYDGYQLIRLYLQTEDHVKLVNDLELADTEFDLWNVARGDQKTADVLLSPEVFDKYTKIFDNLRINYEIVNRNIQNNINEQARLMLESKNSRNILLKYARYNEILNFIDATVFDNSDIASSYIYGKTYENRNLKAIVLKTPTSSRAIWIDCGIHAREWVSPASCVYLIDRLISEYRSSDPTTVALLNKWEIHITPILNPDGYEFSHSTQRLWRKNRSPNQGSSCIGTDLNRNFPYRWLTGGSSTNPCSDTYAGKSAGSELETQAVINTIKQKNGQWDAFISVHSYGNWWLTQWGHSSIEVPSDYNDIVAKGQIGADAIKAFNGSTFIVGSSAKLLYVNTGSSADWAKGAENIQYGYVIELRPGPGTPDYNFGFTLPEDRMKYVAPECFLGIKAFLNSILN
ncbi:unnamed protein product [Brachionus calyciflorus]|uniref:Peptidase M14 domain-containing protein n=1 Tax=Brachionus calyciflorus TaxID=104777 RepID=A0A814HV57_9BILA|nr:unnamed protein product [Brachionus calyciflorus]